MKFFTGSEVFIKIKYPPTPTLTLVTFNIHELCSDVGSGFGRRFPPFLFFFQLLNIDCF